MSCKYCWIWSASLGVPKSHVLWSLWLLLGMAGPIHRKQGDLVSDHTAPRQYLTKQVYKLNSCDHGHRELPVQCASFQCLQEINEAEKQGIQIEWDILPDKTISIWYHMKNPNLPFWVTKRMLLWKPKKTKKMKPKIMHWLMHKTCAKHAYTQTPTWCKICTHS